MVFLFLSCIRVICQINILKDLIGQVLSKLETFR